MADVTVFELDLGGNRGKKAFKSIQDVRDFVRREQDHWAWLSQGQGGEPGHRAWNAVQQPFYNAHQNLQQWQGGSPNHQGSVQNALRHIFVEARLPISTSPTGRFIAELRNRQGDLVAAAAVATAMDQSPIGNGRAWLRGGVELAAFQMGIKSSAAEATLGALNAIEQDMSSILQAQTEAGESERRGHAALIADHARRLEILKRWTARCSERHRKALQTQVDQSIADFKKTENLYKEQMRIKAPVDYWTAKASEHAKAARRQLNRVFWFSGVGGLLLMIVLGGAAYNADRLITANTHLGVLGLYASIGLILTTVAFWAARVMVRLYLSEHHLTLDARERAVMAQTYLALANEGKADEKDRALILGALFKPSSDGIVKDDGAPDIGIAALASKVVSR